MKSQQVGGEQNVSASPSTGITQINRSTCPCQGKFIKLWNDSITMHRRKCNTNHTPMFHQTMTKNSICSCCQHRANPEQAANKIYPESDRNLFVLCQSCWWNNVDHPQCPCNQTSKPNNNDNVKNQIIPKLCHIKQQCYVDLQYKQRGAQGPQQCILLK